ncbi:UbiD family decarboxylase [Paenibacillus sp. P26]|nr:UbiD family decarboxylase [Paenibacillus sp. P26]
MRFENLRTFLEALRKEKQLKVISAPVDPNLELAEIHRRVIDEQGPALLFTNVKGASFPVVTNLFGTSRRVDLAFGPRPEQLMKQIVGAMDTAAASDAQGALAAEGPPDRSLQDRNEDGAGRSGPVLQQCRKEAPLAGLPVLTCWQEDGGPFVTSPLVYTEHPENGHHNLGMYRMQVYDDRTTGMHWQIHKGGGFHYHEAEKRNKPAPVTVFLGGPPALIASAIAPVPEHLPEPLLTSLILGQKLPLAENPQGGGHRLVAEAEFAICGSVQPHLRRPEGPFGDHYGYYSLTHDFPVFDVHHMWHRKDAIYPATIVGKPRQEDYYLGEFLQRLLSPAFPMAMPGVKSLWTYAETGFHSLAAAVVRESYSREALSTAFRILGEGLTLTKFLIVTDRDIDLERFPELLESVLARFEPGRDLFIINHTSHDTLDYTGDRLNHGSKAILLGIGEPKRERRASIPAASAPVSAVPPYTAGAVWLFPAQLTMRTRRRRSGLRRSARTGSRTGLWSSWRMTRG